MAKDVVVPSKEFPFGRDVDTLVVCFDEQHRDQVCEAFQVRARYVTQSGALMGSRFARIVMFLRDEPSVGLRMVRDRWINESVKCRLLPGGQMQYVDCSRVSS